MINEIMEAFGRNSNAEHHHVHVHLASVAEDEWRKRVEQKLDELIGLQTLILRRERQIMTSVADIQNKANSTLAAVRAESDVATAVKKVVDNMNASIAALKQQLADAIAAGADPTQLQSLSDTLDAIQQAQTANAQTVADAVTAGTPVGTNAPQPAPAPAQPIGGPTGPANPA